MRRRVLALAVLAAVACAGPAFAQGGKWGNVEVYEENDTLVPSAISSDALYTQGIRMVFLRQGTQPKIVDDVVNIARPLFGSDIYQGVGGLVFGQNMFTPVVITTFDPDPADRPFAGFLYVGGRVDMVRTDGGSRYSVEANLGLLGPWAFARDNQAGLHVLRQHRIPKGWDRQIGTEIALNTRFAHHRRWGNRFVDITPGLVLALGTVQTYPAVDATLRVGWHLTGMPLGAAPWSARSDTDEPPPNFEIGAFGGAEARYFLRNAYLDGPLFGGPPEVEKEPFVHDLRCGISARYKTWRVTYSLLRRSREFEGEAGKAHYFGSIAVSRELPRTPFPTPKTPSFWRDNWSLEIGMGRGVASFQPELPRQGSGGPAARIGLAKGLTGRPFEEQTRLRDRLSLGLLEMAGVVREGGPPDSSGAHRDDFLATTGGSVRLRPFPPSHWLRHLELRAGAGRAVSKEERTRYGEAFVERSDSGFAVLAGGDYLFQLSGALSLGLGGTWSRLFFDAPRIDDGSFVSWAVVFAWHP